MHMKIKSNVRAGAGGASGAGQNHSGLDNVAPAPVYAAPVTPVYYSPVSRCVGI
jgi:hypothetical protein